LPVAAGIDAFLPPVFAQRNEKTGAPTAAILLQGGLILLMVALGAAGASTAAAYDFLVSMSVLTNTACYLFLFAAYLKVKRGNGRALLIGMIGEIATITAIVGTMIPSGSDPHPLATFLKILISAIVLTVAGLVLYWLGTRRKEAPAT
jgi:glutamate:GABA antiporter